MADKITPPPRAADALVGKGSFADKLRQRRIDIESGSLGMENTGGDVPGTDDRRGYVKEKWDTTK